jgi:hypothetical protein
MAAKAIPGQDKEMGIGFLSLHLLSLSYFSSSIWVCHCQKQKFGSS